MDVECKSDKRPPAQGAAGFKPTLSCSLLHFLPSMRILVEKPLCCPSVKVPACMEPFHGEEAPESAPVPSRVLFRNPWLL